MQYAPTKTWYVSIKYVLIESFSRQKLDSPLKQPTHNDPFFVYLCRDVLHTPQKHPWQWEDDSSTRYVSIKYVFIESFSRQKLDSPLKPPTRNDPFLWFRCRGVFHTPHKRPRQGTNKSIHHPFFWIHVIHWIKNPVHFGSYAILPYPDGSKIRFPIKTTYP